MCARGSGRWGGDIHAAVTGQRGRGRARLSTATEREQTGAVNETSAVRHSVEGRGLGQGEAGRHPGRELPGAAAAAAASDIGRQPGRAGGG